MSDSAEKFLTATERRQIEARIAEAKKHTSGEIVVMVVPSSYHYPLATMLGSLLLAILLGIAATFLSRNESIWFFLPVFGVSFMLFHELIKRIDIIKRVFVTASDMKGEVDEAAIQSFYHRKINHTVAHTGILIYISLFEHKVRVIADKGINEKVPQDLWQEIVNIIIRGISGKKHGNAIAAAIDRCGEILSSHFPAKLEDRNELGNEVIIGRG